MSKPAPPVAPPARSPMTIVPSHTVNALLSQRLFVASIICIVLAVVATVVDLPIAYAFLGKVGPIWLELREAIYKFVRPAETFANGLGVLFLMFLLFAADVAYRRGLLRMGCIIFGAGIWSNVLKGAVARTRPRAYFDVDANHFHGGVLESFQGWLPLNSLGYGGQSIPSGHTTTAVALAIVLSRRWPRAAWAFFTVAGLSVVQRISHGHHYLSDCLAGAALAFLMAAVIYHPRLLGRWFDWFESLPATRWATPLTPAREDSASPPPRKRRAA